MALFEGKTPAERNKLIAAIVLPVVTLVCVVYMFSGPSAPNRAATGPTPKPAPRRTPGPPVPTDTPDDVGMIMPVVCCPEFGGGSDAGRNIFAFYEKPPAPAGPAVSSTPTPTPTPPPPWVLASLAPQSVFAKTAGITLPLSGDKV